MNGGYTTSISAEPQPSGSVLRFIGNTLAVFAFFASMVVLFPAASLWYAAKQINGHMQQAEAWEKLQSRLSRAAIALHPIAFALQRTWAFLNHWLVVMWTISALSIYATYHWQWAFDLSGAAYGLAKISMLLTVVGIIDKRHFKAIDTIEQLKRQNLAYALVLIACLLVGAFLLSQS